jgi:hypothetical protein
VDGYRNQSSNQEVGRNLQLGAKVVF